MNTLVREAVPAIVVASTTSEFVFQVRKYGADPDDPDIYMVLDADDARELALTLPADTPWCVADDWVAPSVKGYMKSVFGENVSMARALNMKNTGVAIDPKLLRRGQ